MEVPTWASSRTPGAGRRPNEEIVLTEREREVSGGSVTDLRVEKETRDEEGSRSDVGMGTIGEIA